MLLVEIDVFWQLPIRRFLVGQQGAGEAGSQVQLGTK
jgi:hypothetical protein